MTQHHLEKVDASRVLGHHRDEKQADSSKHRATRVCLRACSDDIGCLLLKQPPLPRPRVASSKPVASSNIACMVAAEYLSVVPRSRLFWVRVSLRVRAVTREL